MNLVFITTINIKSTLPSCVQEEEEEDEEGDRQMISITKSPGHIASSDDSSFRSIQIRSDCCANRTSANRRLMKSRKIQFNNWQERASAAGLSLQWFSASPTAAARPCPNLTNSVQSLQPTHDPRPTTHNPHSHPWPPYRSQIIYDMIPRQSCQSAIV